MAPLLQEDIQFQQMSLLKHNSFNTVHTGEVLRLMRLTSLDDPMVIAGLDMVSEKTSYAVLAKSLNRLGTEVRCKNVLTRTSSSNHEKGKQALIQSTERSHSSIVVPNFLPASFFLKPTLT